jgi:hypothetical protein
MSETQTPPTKTPPAVYNEPGDQAFTDCDRCGRHVDHTYNPDVVGWWVCSSCGGVTRPIRPVDVLRPKDGPDVPQWLPPVQPSGVRVRRTTRTGRRWCRIRTAPTPTVRQFFETTRKRCLFYRVNVTALTLGSATDIKVTAVGVP